MTFPAATIGILGGGQLGRMLAMAAARLGMRTHVFEPAPDACAGQVADALTTAPYEDDAALGAFAGSVDVVTYEFENVPLRAIDAVARRAPVRPGRRALEVAQDRMAEKDFLRGIGLATAPYAAVGGPEDLAAALARIGGPAILKTRRLGYDGKGQVRIASETDAAAAWGAVGAAMACFHEALSYAKERVMFGGPIGGKQIQQVRLADMLTSITQAQLLCYRLGRLKDEGTMKPEQVSLAKRANVSMATDIAREARRLLGGNGILVEYHSMRHMANLESVYTYEGTHDVHSLILGQSLTGLNAF